MNWSLNDNARNGAWTRGNSGWEYWFELTTEMRVHRPGAVSLFRRRPGGKKFVYYAGYPSVAHTMREIVALETR